MASRLHVATTLTLIDEAALTAWDRTWVGRADGFNWRELEGRFRKRVGRFEGAVWSGDLLCGLFYGTVSRKRTVVRVDYVEGRNESHPLTGRIALIAAELATLYAQLYGSHLVRFHKPLSGAIKHYERIGFIHVPGTKHQPSFCEKLIP